MRWWVRWWARWCCWWARSRARRVGVRVGGRIGWRMGGRAFGGRVGGHVGWCVGRRSGWLPGSTAARIRRARQAPRSPRSRCFGPTRARAPRRFCARRVCVLADKWPGSGAGVSGAHCGHVHGGTASCARVRSPRLADATLQRSVRGAERAATHAHAGMSGPAGGEGELAGSGASDGIVTVRSAEMS